MKQIEIKCLAQGNKHTGHSRAQTHNIDGLVIMSSSLVMVYTSVLPMAEDYTAAVYAILKIYWYGSQP